MDFSVLETRKSTSKNVDFLYRITGSYMPLNPLTSHHISTIYDNLIQGGNDIYMCCIFSMNKEIYYYPLYDGPDFDKEYFKRTFLQKYRKDIIYNVDANCHNNSVIFNVKYRLASSYFLEFGLKNHGYFYFMNLGWENPNYYSNISKDAWKIMSHSQNKGTE